MDKNLHQQWRSNHDSHHQWFDHHIGPFRCHEGCKSRPPKCLRIGKLRFFFGLRESLNQNFLTLTQDTLSLVGGELTQIEFHVILNLKITSEIDTSKLRRVTRGSLNSEKVTRGRFEVNIKDEPKVKTFAKLIRKLTS